MVQGKTNVVDKALLVDEKPGYVTNDTHLKEARNTLKNSPTRVRHGPH